MSTGINNGVPQGQNNQIVQQGQPEQQGQFGVVTQPGQDDYRADMSAIPVNALEFLRLKLMQLTLSLGVLHQLLAKPVLPPWPSLSSQFNVVLKQLISLSETLTQYRDILSKTVAYPLPSFPLAVQGGLLRSLLRKKPTPEVEEWIQQGREVSKGAGIKVQDDEDFCAFASSVVNEELGKHNWSGFVTRAEMKQGMVDKGISIKHNVQKKPLQIAVPTVGGSAQQQQQGQPRPIGTVPSELRMYEDGGWPVERVMSYMFTGPPTQPRRTM